MKGFFWALVGAAGLAAAAQAAEGRWEGVLQVPGAATPVVLDLERRDGRWIGSALLFGRGAPAARLRALEVQTDGALRATLAIGQGAEFVFALRPSADGKRLDGEGQQGGHGVPLSLVRSGAAQVAAVPAGVPLAPALAGVWRGRYDLGFGPRDITLRIAPPGATATIIGRRTFEVTFDEVLQYGAFVTLRSSEFDITIEAPWASAAQGTLTAAWTQGPFESTLVLRREGGP